MAGFIGGILFANLTVKDYVTTSGIFNPYFLKQYAQSEIEAGEYILYLCGIRLIPLLLIVFLGQTRVRRIATVAVFVWAGFFDRNNCVCGDSEYGNSGYCVLGDCDGAAVPFLRTGLSDCSVAFFHFSAGQMEYGKDLRGTCFYDGRTDYGSVCQSDFDADVSGYIVKRQKKNKEDSLSSREKEFKLSF